MSPPDPALSILKNQQLSPKLDQFFTTHDVASFCLERTINYLKQSKSKWLWVEPSAGAGAFYNLLPTPKIGLDIMPRHPEVVATDFLLWVPPSQSRKVVAIGNPPFGKNSSLARKFFDYAATFADIIAFIVPRTFEKPLFQSRLNKHMHLAEAHFLDPCSFEYDGLPYSVPTVFQIWEKKTTQRPPATSIRDHKDFSFTTHDVADFAFQRVGANAGLVSVAGLKKSKQSHYFLKAHIPANILFKRLQGIDWTPIKSRTAGNPSIGKGELVLAYQSLS